MPIKKCLKESLVKHLKDKSVIASNRLVKRDGQFVTARYLSDTNSVLYDQFPFKNELSYSTFYKYLKQQKVFKKPHRLTDLCDYCEWAKSIEKKLFAFLETEKYDFSRIFDSGQALSFLDSLKSKLIDEQIGDQNKLDEYDYFAYILKKYQAVMFHKKIAETQREAYNYQRKSIDFLTDTLLIVADFKEKISIGLSPSQVSREWYDQPKRACLGILSILDYA